MDLSLTLNDIVLKPKMENTNSEFEELTLIL